MCKFLNPRLPSCPRELSQRFCPRLETPFFRPTLPPILVPVELQVIQGDLELVDNVNLDVFLEEEFVEEVPVRVLEPVDIDPLSDTDREIFPDAEVNDFDGEVREVEQEGAMKTLES